MVWWGTLSGGLAVLLAAFMTGAPIFIAFLVINIGGVLIVLGQPGFGMVANSIFETTNIAALSAVPLFILMGELLFRSGSIDILFDRSTSWSARCAGGNTCCASCCRPSSARCPARRWASPR